MTFTPTRLTITDITRADPAVVTVSTDHKMTTGQVVRLTVPKDYGMQEINGLLAQMTNLTSTTFSLQLTQSAPGGNVNVNSINFQAFTNVGTGTPPQVFPVGSGSTPATFPEVSARNGVCTTLLDDAWTNVALTNQPF